MSGGYFDYQDSTLKNEIFRWDIETVEQAMKQNPLEDKEFSGMVFEMLDILSTFDWYKSGDTNKEPYIEALTNFKNKWMNSEAKDRIRYVIDTSLQDLKEELYSCYNIINNTTEK